MIEHTYYPHLPKNKIELLAGRVYLGGSLAVSRMVLRYLLQAQGDSC